MRISDWSSDVCSSDLWRVHERMWPIKYIIFLGLFGVSLGSLAFAEVLAEIEPFKTAIVLRFMRDWWFVVFALVLIGAGLFVERIGRASCWERVCQYV